MYLLTECTYTNYVFRHKSFLLDISPEHNSQSTYNSNIHKANGKNARNVTQHAQYSTFLLQTLFKAFKEVNIKQIFSKTCIKQNCSTIATIMRISLKHRSEKKQRIYAQIVEKTLKKGF